MIYLTGKKLFVACPNIWGVGLVVGFNTKYVFIFTEETWLKPKHFFIDSVYNIYKADRQGAQHGRVPIAVHHSIEHSFFHVLIPRLLKSLTYRWTLKLAKFNLLPLIFLYFQFQMILFYLHKFKNNNNSYYVVI